jgi:hypothetical protein
LSARRPLALTPGTGQNLTVRRGTVLCLDVDPIVLEAITRPVADAGYDVVRRSRAEAASAVADASIVVADLRPDGPPLPSLGGRPLVALLGRGTPEPAGAVEALVDPADAEVVLAAVDRALARHRLAEVTESLQGPLRSLVDAVREAEAAYDTDGADAARPHLERIRDALSALESRVSALDEEES